MGMFGKMFGGSGIVATPEQEEESRRMAAQLGIPYEEGTGPAQQTPQQAPQEAPRGYWDGGGKIRGRDALAGALAGVSDAFAQAGGAQGGAVERLMGGRMSAMQEAKKRQEQQMQLAQMIAVGKANGMSEEQVRAQVLGLKTPEGPKPTTEMQNFEAFQKMTPEQRAAYNQYRDANSPIITNGYGSTVVPRSALSAATGGLPAQYNPNEWEVVDAPANAHASSGGGAPDEAQTMERLYIQQFGEARGRPMFNEWLRMTRGGR